MAEEKVEERIQILENCQVEWDKKRGVLYVHNKETGASVVRISDLPPCRNWIDLTQGLIDIRAEESKVTMPLYASMLTKEK